jgi:succinoglycan biosynthesis transport protein ExoP
MPAVLNVTLPAHSDNYGLDGDDGPGWNEILSTWLRDAWYIVPVTLLGAALGYVSTFLTPTYEAEAVLVLDRASAGKLENAADSPTLDAQQKAALVRSNVEILRGTEIVDAVARQLDLAKQPMFTPGPGALSRLATSITAAIGLAAGPHPATDARTRLDHIYLDHLSVAEDPDTYILHVRFRAPDPDLAAAVVNAHVAQYKDWLRNQQSHAIDDARAWLGRAVSQAHARLEAAQDAVQAFQAGGILFNVEGRTPLDQGLQQLTTDLATAQDDAVRAEARIAEIRRMQRSGETAGIAAMTGSKALESLDSSYAAAISNRADMLSTHGPGYPGSIAAEARVAELRQAVAAEIDTIVQSQVSQANIARATVGNLTAALDRMKQQVIAAEHGRDRLTRLQGDVAAERAQYMTLLQKRDSYDQVSSLVRADVTILSPASPPDTPRAPQRSLAAMFGLLVSGGAAAGGSAWRLARREGVRDASDAMKLTGTRCLGVMPELRRSGGDIDRAQPDFALFHQELRSICAVLARDHARQQQAGITLLVTSCLRSEGKSTFCRELGRFTAEGGVRTLIIRTDLPLLGDHGQSLHIAQEADGMLLFNLDWCPPATMFGSQTMARLLEAWRQEFGLIIFDTPPVTAMAESIMLAPLVDATIVLARAHSTPRSLLASVTGRIGLSGGRVAGLVLSFVQLGGHRGLSPSDPAYYFRSNRLYYQRAWPRRQLDRV